MKPNCQRVPSYFDETIVFNQLQSSGSIAYYKLMQTGFPTKIPIAELFQKLQPYTKPNHLSIGINNCCRIFLIANKLLSKNFKFGKAEIHIRPGQSHLLYSMNIAIQRSNDEIAFKFKKGFNAFMRLSKAKFE